MGNAVNQCCMRRDNAGKPPEAETGGTPERFAAASRGSFASGKVATVRMLAACSAGDGGAKAPGRGNNLYLGNWRAGRNIKTLTLHKIPVRIEVCMKKDFGEDEDLKVPPRVHRVVMSSVQPQTIVSIVDECSKFIAECESLDVGHILIHSFTANHITEMWSIVIACGCLMKLHRWPLDHALYTIESQSPDIELPYSLHQKLQHYERYLNLMGVSSVDGAGLNAQSGVTSRDGVSGQQGGDAQGDSGAESAAKATDEARSRSLARRRSPPAELPQTPTRLRRLHSIPDARGQPQRSLLRSGILGKVEDLPGSTSAESPAREYTEAGIESDARPSPGIEEKGLDDSNSDRAATGKQRENEPLILEIDLEGLVVPHDDDAQDDGDTGGPRSE